MPKIRLSVESPVVIAVVLVLTLGCTRCGAGSQNVPDSTTAATAQQQPAEDFRKEPSKGNEKEAEPVEPRPSYCRDLANGTVSLCGDKTSVDSATER